MEQSLLLQAILFPFLAVLTYYDLKYKKIPVVLLLIMGIVGIVYTIIIEDYDNFLRYMGIFMGLIFLSLSFVSHEAIGKGDALVFVILGWFLGIYETIFLLFVAFSLSAAVSVVLLVCRKGNFMTSFPFLPFLYLAFGGVCLL